MTIAIDGFAPREATFYHALLQLSRLARHGHGAELRQRSLGDEQRMARWARENLSVIAVAGDGSAEGETPGA